MIIFTQVVLHECICSDNKHVEEKSTISGGLQEKGEMHYKVQQAMKIHNKCYV